jgi:phenylpropionate dioxygenase-like ring-hydroxylating dioxygenase large terminal subunit
MSEKQVEAPAPLSGYLRKPATVENTELTHVEKGTPCGEYLRRFWQPFLIAAELKDVPLPVDLLGEKLVVFRDKSGDLGLLDRFCSHRGVSLEFGLIRERGVQCAYHGWHFGTDGTILDIPGATDADIYRNAFCHGAYPIQEHHGILFAYLGPPDQVPDFPRYDFMEFPDQTLSPLCFESPCNWLQIRENTQDPMHVSFLHSMFGNPQFGPWSYDIPVMTWTETPIGQITVSARHTHGRLYARINEFILPNFSRVPDLPPLDMKTQRASNRSRGLSLWVVPRNRTQSIMIGWLHETPDMDAEWRTRNRAMLSLGQSEDRPYDERQRYPGDWDAWVSQGPIAIQGNEHLCQTDGGVALMRTQLRKGIRAVQNGETPKGLMRGKNAALRSYAGNFTEDVPPGLNAENERDILNQFAERAMQMTLAGQLQD